MGVSTEGIMYEITHKGAWFKWSTLDATDKKLAGLSLAAIVPPSFLLGLVAGAYGVRLGYWFGSGGKAMPQAHLDDLISGMTPPSAVLGALACVIVSALAWWRFSLRQDEMFNRIQNHALGHGCGWTVAALALWWFLENAGLVPALPVTAWLVLALLLVCGFWFRAVRRWA
jgi:hypothetical protein